MDGGGGGEEKEIFPSPPTNFCSFSTSRASYALGNETTATQAKLNFNTA